MVNCVLIETSVGTSLIKLTFEKSDPEISFVLWAIKLRSYCLH